MLVSLGMGCASWTNPIANGVPVRMVPPELLAEPKENLEPTPLTYLRRKPPTEHIIGPRDLLGVYVESILGEETQLPPVNFPASGNLPPSLGFPVPVREDGTLPLPLIEPLQVSGLTIAEVQDRLVEAFTKKKHLLQPEEPRILVTIIRPRHVRVLVIREDSAAGSAPRSVRRSPLGGTEIGGGRSRGSGAVLELPADEADVLAALAETGGLPGVDAANEVVIQRGYAGDDKVTGQPRPVAVQSSGLVKQRGTSRQTVRIPLRLPPGAPPPFEPEDVVLRDGDIIYIAARDSELYYTGGLLPSIEVPLPRDYDLDAVEAVARVGGTLVSGGINNNNLSGGLVNPGIGAPSPSLLTVLRRLPDGRQAPIRVDLNEALRDPRENILIQAGDILILQETPGESLTRYATSVFNFGIFTDLFRRGSATGTATLNLP